MNKFICMYIHVNISKRAQTTGNNGFFFLREKYEISQTKMYTIYTGKK